MNKHNKDRQARLSTPPSGKNSSGKVKSFFLLLAILLIVITVPLPGKTYQPVEAAVNINFVGSWTSDETTDSLQTVWGDMDGDGDMDIAVANGSVLDGQANHIYRNNGDETFTLVWQSTDTIFTASVDWGDMDNDGDLDLVFGNNLAPNQVYENQGSGNFVLAWESTGDEKPTRSTVWGDIDGDGDLDLAVGNLGEVTQIYRNNGNATFSQVWTSTGQLDTTVSVAWGDMDNDGDLDLAVGNTNTNNQVYRNNGSANFTLAWETTNDAKNTFSIAWADVDGDSFLDLGMGNGSILAGEINQIYHNQGNGTFALSWESTSIVRETRAIAFGDADGDGDLDLAVGNDEEPNEVYQNDGTGQFTRLWESVGDTKESYSIAWGDMDGDGDLDLTIGNLQQINQIYRNDGGAGLNLSGFSFNDADTSQSLAWGDMDGDGDLDIAFGNDGPNKIYENDGEGHFSQVWESIGDSKYTISAAWGDMDGDGDLDIAFGNANDLTGGEVNQIFRNNGNGSFTLAWESTGDSKNSLSVAWGDMDGDGDLDIAFGNSDLNGAPNQIYRNDGNSQFSLFWESEELNDTTSVAWGDMDNDGDLDLAVGNRYFLDGDVNQLYRNDAELGFTRVWESPDVKWTESIAWGDVDQDGDLDLAVGNTLQVNQIFQNNGNSQFTLSWESVGDTNKTSKVVFGDMDGDADLDLAVGNYDEVNQIYRNQGGQFSLIWQSVDDTHSTFDMAWGDIDHDGDLDLAVANISQSNLIYKNPRQGQSGLPNKPSTISILRPGSTAGADFFATAEVITTSPVPIYFSLYDHESDPVRLVTASYSLNGGGSWYPATLVNGTLTNNLATAPWPTGVEHLLLWDAEKDLIKNDNIVFRITLHQGGPGPYSWPPAAAQTFPLRLEVADWYARVVNENGQALSGALVYYDGEAVSIDDTPSLTDAAGLLRLDSPAAGKPLTALYERHQQSTIRAAHNGWAYRTYLTSVDLDAAGSPQFETVGQPGEQLVTIFHDAPLVLFNIVVSIEWNADQDYLAIIADSFDRASDYLYDISDGQMAFGEVQIFDNATHWSDADFQISTKNTVRPYAYIGGINSADSAHSIRIGRFWNGNSGNQGNWNEKAGYRTLIHEFAHYALYLQDEYFMRILNDAGEFVGQNTATCTGLGVIGSDDTPTNGSIMYYQYNTSELVDTDRWTLNCQATEQARVNGESDWQTVLNYYAGSDWALASPAGRGSIMAGPDAFPNHLLPFPTITTEDMGTDGEPRQVIVCGPGGQPFVNALVALYTTRDNYTVAIDQGVTDRNGQLTVYGAENGDVIQVASFDGELAGAVTVSNALSYIINLEATSSGGLLITQGSGTAPYLNLIPGSEGDSLFLEVHGAPASGLPLPATVIPAAAAGIPQSTSLAYVPSENAFKGQVSFAGVGLGSGEVQINGVAGGQLITLNSDYNLMQVLDNQTNDLASEDGNFQLHVGVGSLLNHANAYAVILPTGYLPTPLPDNTQLLGSAYELRFSGAATGLTKPGLLRMHYHPQVVGEKAEVAIYRWHEATQSWTFVGGDFDQQNNMVSVPITQFGIYASGGVGDVLNTIFLPAIVNH